jgi:replicative DNA helicase
MEDKDRLKQMLDDLLQDNTEVGMSDYYDEAGSAYDTFNEQSRHIGKGYSCPDFPFFDKKMEGLLPGLYLFAARSNCGKTALMTNLMWSYCTNPDNHLFGIYYSLDDSCNEVIPRLMSMLQKIPISVCSKPQRYEELVEQLSQSQELNDQMTADTYQEYLQKREMAIQQLKDAREHFFILDRNKIDGFEKLMDHAKKVQAYVKEKDPRNDIMICIDAVSDLSFTNRHFKSSDEEYREISKNLKALSDTLNVVVFGSAHLKKTGDNKRPQKDDLKDTNRFQYDASAIFLLHNDVSENKQNASIFYGQSPDVQPIIEIDWSKNKKSSYKGRSYCYFQPDYSYTQECSDEDRKRYDSLVYSN